MSPDDPRGVLRDIADQLPDLLGEVKGLREEVQKDRRMIGWLRAACAVLGVAVLVAVSWTAYQQAVIDSKSMAIAALADQNAGRAAEQARNAHDLCVKLNRSRNEFLPVWVKVLSGRPDGRGLLARIEAAIPLGVCPKA